MKHLLKQTKYHKCDTVSSHQSQSYGFFLPDECILSIDDLLNRAPNFSRFVIKHTWTNVRTNSCTNCANLEPNYRHDSSFRHDRQQDHCLHCRLLPRHRHHHHRNRLHQEYQVHRRHHLILVLS
jgi:hypothetical protein